jgi:hypothetical protein
MGLLPRVFWNPADINTALVASRETIDQLIVAGEQNQEPKASFVTCDL